MGPNSLTITLSGTYSWISTTTPLTVTVTGNYIKAYSTGISGNVEVAGTANTQTFSLTSSTATQTLCGTCGDFYNFSGMTLAGSSAQSVVATVTEGYNSIHGTIGTANTMVFTDTATSASSNMITLDYEGANSVSASQWITQAQPLTAIVTGYTISGTTPSSSPTSVSVTFTSNSAVTAGGSTAANSLLQTPAGLGFYNVTSIQLSRALPGSLSVTANGMNPSVVTDSVQLAQLVAVGTTAGTNKVSTPLLIYSQAGKTYSGASLLTANSVIYNQQNGQPTNAFQLNTQPAANVVGSGVGQYYQYIIGEVAVPTNTAATDSMMIGIDNNSAGIVGQPVFQLNYSGLVASKGAVAGTKNNVTYGPSSLGTGISVPQGFRTERGSKVVSITPTTVTLNLAKAVDTLQFQVGMANTTVGSAKTFHLYGPYTVGQATNIANVSIGPVNASVKLGTGTVYSVTGIGNLTATPSVTTAYQPVWLKNLTTTPLVVLDTQASPGSNLILIGSGYVNALSQQVQNSYNVSITPSTSQPIVQAEGNNKILVAGYTAAQTVQAGNSFIQQLYAQAH
jgi:hypothetical protein